MNLKELKQLASTLPMEPGVYLMKDEKGTIIYVGKAKKLRNRVSQYFLDSASHSLKTRLMVSKVRNFEVIIAANEFEALVLESSLIKRHMPKYNILLKDDKGYPYLRLDMKQAYPVLSMVNKPADDNAEYFGPYGSRSVTQSLLDSIRLTMKLPGCTKKFPRDIGKERPCLNYHMNQCTGWCQSTLTQESYRELMEQVRQLLRGNYKQLISTTKAQMLEASEELNFELAASLRDRVAAFESLGQKQLVTAGKIADTDVIGFALGDTKACFTVLHFSGGNLLDKEFEIIPATEDTASVVGSLIAQHYLCKGFSPKRIFLPTRLEDQHLYEQLFFEKLNCKTKLVVPQRGDNMQLVNLAAKNATEELQRSTSKDEKMAGSLNLLGKMLGIEPPRRIESYDISNISGTDIVAGMVVFVDGKPRKSEYKKFKIKDLEDQNDYASMYQVVKRRFTRYINSDPGFSELPDILLIDGGCEHASVAVQALQELNLDIPTFGMVKDDHHRTRALVTAHGDVIDIAAHQSVFSLIGTIQEHTHNYAVGYHRNLRSKRLQYSQLDTIAGIGPVRKQVLLKHFKSLTGIREATLEELERLLPQDTAMAVYNHFHNQ